jgi:cytochrome c553
MRIPAPVFEVSRRQIRILSLDKNTTIPGTGGIGGCCSGLQSGGSNKASICAWVYFLALPGICFCTTLSTTLTFGVKPPVQACARCHLPSGAGHPESSSLAGLPAPYIIRQMAAFKNEERTGIRAANMIAFAKAPSNEDALAAAEYFAALKPAARTKVIETEMVRISYIGPGAMRFAAPGGGTEPIGTASSFCHRTRSARKAAIRIPALLTTVPMGSIQRGECAYHDRRRRQDNPMLDLSRTEPQWACRNPT